MVEVIIPALLLPRNITKLDEYNKDLSWTHIEHKSNQCKEKYLGNQIIKYTEFKT